VSNDGSSVVGNEPADTSGSIGPALRGERLAEVNGWDPDRLADIRAHPLLAGIRGAADSVLKREQLTEVARALPERWPRGAAALGSPSECWGMFERYREAGADEPVLHGSTPDQLGDVIGGRPPTTPAVR